MNRRLRITILSGVFAAFAAALILIVGIRAEAEPRPAHMPVLVDFWRQADHSDITLSECWTDLTNAYNGIATISSTTIVQTLAGSGSPEVRFTLDADNQKITFKFTPGN